MIRSMTGYGRSQQVLDGREVTVEIKSVNHRFFEFSARTPRSMGFLEEKLKSYVQRRVGRGKVDVSVSIVTLSGVSAGVLVNHELAGAYLSSLRGLAAELGVQDDLTLSALARFSDIFIQSKPQEDEDEIWGSVQMVLSEALERFVDMRQREGEQLCGDILSHLDAIERMAGEVEQRSEKTVADYRQRLYNKIAEILADNRMDEQRILTEAALFAERIATAEETVRLGSHLTQFRDIMASGGAVGRKLDFLVQELNREVNTIGSKAQDSIVTALVVEMKSEIEKIREQIQNVE